MNNRCPWCPGRQNPKTNLVKDQKPQEPVKPKRRGNRFKGMKYVGFWNELTGNY